MVKLCAKELLPLCCLIGLGAGPAFGGRMLLLPVGVQPGDVTTWPYTHTAAPGEVVEVDFWVEDTEPSAIAGWQVQMPCLAAEGNGGSIDFKSRSFDENRVDYIFSGLATLGIGGNDGTCPGGGVPPGDIYLQAPVLGTMVVGGAHPVVTGPVCLGIFNYTVSQDAKGLFTLDPLCYPRGPDPNCPTFLTYVFTDIPQPIWTEVEPLLINVVSGDHCPQGAVAFNDPPDGVVDARQPHAANSLEPSQGIAAVEVSAPGGADAGCWSLCEKPRRADPNHIAGVADNGDGTYTVSLARPITPGAVTSLTYTPSKGPAVTARFLSHPANVNGDGSTSPTDLLKLIDYLNGVSTPPWGLFSTDSNRDGRFGALDVLRTIDLLYGAGTFQAWSGTDRPANDAPCP